MRRNNTESIGQVLKQFMEENPFIKRKIAENRAIEAWKIVAKGAVSYTTNIYIRFDVLYVHLSSAVLRQELQMMTAPLIEKINAYAGMPIITKIVLK